jgi:hypothetical protein
VHLPEWVGMAVPSCGNGVRSCQSQARVIIICSYVSTHLFLTVCSQVFIVISEELADPVTKECRDVGLMEDNVGCWCRIFRYSTMLKQ